jgi:hypothetical protein
MTDKVEKRTGFLLEFLADHHSASASEVWYKSESEQAPRTPSPLNLVSPLDQAFDETQNKDVNFNITLPLASELV